MSESDVSNMPPFIGLAHPLSEVSPQKPDWNATCEAMRWLNDVEAMQGGRNGPTIKLRAAIEALQADVDKWKGTVDLQRKAAVQTYDMHQAEVARLSAECDAISELNHCEYLALENCRLLAARHRSEEWAQHILRFCDEGGIRAIHLRQVKSAFEK